MYVATADHLSPEPRFGYGPDAPVRITGPDGRVQEVTLDYTGRFRMQVEDGDGIVGFLVRGGDIGGYEGDQK